MSSIERFVDSLANPEDQLGLSASEIGHIEETLGSPAPPALRSYWERYGNQPFSWGEIEARSFVHGSNFSCFPESGYQALVRRAEQIVDSPLREQLGMPLFPLGASEGGNLLVANDRADCPVLFTSLAEPWWQLASFSLQALLDTWILPEELGRWPGGKQAQETPVLEVRAEAGEVFERRDEIGRALNELTYDLVEVPKFAGHDLVVERYLSGFVLDWFHKRFVVHHDNRLLLPTFMLRTRFGGFLGSATAVAVAKTQNATIIDGVGFLGVGIGVELGPSEAETALLALNPSKVDLDSLALTYRNEVAMVVNETHRFGLD